MFDLQRVWLVAKREWFVRLKQRSFQITTLVQLIIFLAAASIPVISSAFGDDGGGNEDTVTVLVLDETGDSLVDPLAAGLSAEVPDQPRIVIESTSESREDVQQRIDDDDADAGLAIARNDAGALEFALFNESGDVDILTQRISGAVTYLNLEDQLAQLGIEGATYDQAVAAPSIVLNASALGIDEESDAEGNAKFVIAYVFAFLSYMVVILYGNWVAQGVVEEKSSRIMEIMINAATPRDLLLGKVLGIGMAAMTQLLPTIVLGGIVLSLQRQIADRLDLGGSAIIDIDYGALSLQSGGWFLIYFIFGFVLFAALYAGIGSLVSRQEEVNQAIAPMTTISIGGFFGAIFTLSAPDSMLARVLSIVPFTSPTTMVPRIILGNPQPWELALSLVLLIATAVLALMVAARIYRVGVLMYGQKPKLRSVFSSGSAEVSR
ncbi:MAG: ABC transporter permease [Thermomicrobiales bacterium]